MRLVADVTLARGTYAAAGMDPEDPESVPSPYRLFCALVATAAKSGPPADNPALRWLEEQEPPTLTVPPVLDQGINESYVVTNRRAKSGSTTHPARTNGARRRAWVNFAGDGFQLRWDTAPDEAVLTNLQELARSITYLGRVESHARVRFRTAQLPDDQDGATQGQADASTNGLSEALVWEPVELSQPGTDVAVPYRGALGELAEAHERDEPAWTTARRIRYRRRRSDPAQATPGPFDGLVVFRIPDTPLDATSLMEATVSLRTAVMSRVADVTGPEDIPGPVHGHVRDIVHVAYVALPFVDHRHADGAIRGLALALPRTLSAQDRAVLGQALTPSPGGPGLQRVKLAGRNDAHLAVEHDPLPTTPWAINSRRWAGDQQGSTHWTTATPMMLGKFPKHDGEVTKFVTEACVRARYPEPITIRATRSPMVTGATVWQPHWHGLLGSGRPRRPVLHVKLEFPEPVVGPVIIGSLRYLGMGLCIPGGQPADEDTGGQS